MDLWFLAKDAKGKGRESWMGCMCGVLDKDELEGCVWFLAKDAKGKGREGWMGWMCGFIAKGANGEGFLGEM